ncbi:MAG TPA: hypothetical protein VN224_02900 [Xanthomonadales bacterium]|nr:hypothetical protein [Xanthomonadales bacterium]
MTDDVLFCGGLVDDVRRCAAERAPALVAEIEARIERLLVAAPPEREHSLAHVVAAVNALLAGVPRDALGSAARLRAFVRENAHLERARDLSITDFRFVMLPDGALSDRSRRSYLSYARIPPATKPGHVLDETVSGPARSLVAWALYTLCGAAAATAIWFAFLVPCSCAVPSWSLERFQGSAAALRAPNMSALARLP